MKNMNLKEALEIIGKGKDAAKIAEIREYMRIDVNTKSLKKAVNNTPVIEEVKPVVRPVVEEVRQAEVVEIIPINKPSDRFNVDCYIAYREYVEEYGKEIGKVPSLDDYFDAIEYYKARNERPIWR